MRHKARSSAADPLKIAISDIDWRPPLAAELSLEIGVS